MRLLALFAAAFALLTTAAPAHSQATLRVTALNVERNVGAADVPLIIENNAIGFRDTLVTDAQGQVVRSGLSTAGRYTVRAPETNRFYAARLDDLSLRSNQTRSVTLFLSPLAAFELEQVTVTDAGVAEVNRVDAEVSATLPVETLQATPVEGRALSQVLYRLPNVTQATGFFPEAPTVSINGANGLYANYMIDGMDNNENFLGGPQMDLPINIIQDVMVLTSNYSAEYGRTGNGVINVTTKSGSNTWRGEAYYLTRPGQPLDGNTQYAQRDLSGNAVSAGFERHQGGVHVGGPLVKDQTFVFASASHIADWKDNLLRVPQLGLQQTVPGRNQFSYATLRLDHRWTDKWRSTLRTNWQRVRIERQGGGLTGGVLFPSAANTQQRDGGHVALQTTYAGSRLVYEGNVQYSRFHWNYANPANPNSPQVTVLDPQETTIAVLGHPGYTFDETENTLQVQQKLTWNWGAHTLKTGVDVINTHINLLDGGNPNGNYTVRLTADQVAALNERGITQGLRATDLSTLPGPVNVLNYAVELRPGALTKWQNQVGVYAEDRWAVSSALTVTAGLRWDYDSLSKGGGTTGDWNNIAPRLSLNYALSPRSSVRAGYGIFYDKVLAAIYTDAVMQSTTSAAYRDQLQTLIDQGRLPAGTSIARITANGNLTATVPNASYLDAPRGAALAAARDDVFSNERRILNPNGYENPMTQQFSIGYQRQLGASTLFYVDLMHTRSRHLPRLVDLNAPAPYDVSAAELAAAGDPADVVRSQFAADQTRPTDIFQRTSSGAIARDANGNPLYRPGAARTITMTEMAGAARYWAATFNVVNARGRDDFSYRLSYTLSRLRNNTDDINFRAEVANDFADEWGPSVNDRTHVMEGLVTYYPTAGLGVTLGATVQSGQPVNRIPDAVLFGTTDLNGDGRSYGAAYVGNSDRWPGTARNSDRLPWAATFDVSVRYAVPLYNGRVQLTADVFNVLNDQNWSGYANSATQSNQIQVGPARRGLVKKNAGPPRQFQFGIAYRF
ncbi:TonB-dependent receptor plug domain-containing protein [Salisaeta longa]|uniref:TonB-dependent receptor plug domain-containing protein n=1 Tax=Salisaeta longa TaxID=503170 RepID=UPI000427E765|nr:TonB-dependent receptor [Salisaeta longa]